MVFDDNTEIRFRYLGVAPVEWGSNDLPVGGGYPVVEMDDTQHNLHELQEGHTIVDQEEIPCNDL